MSKSPLEYIDPFLGVDWPGNCLCGPYLPFSLVRLGPDTVQPADTTGYASGNAIRCFSHTHVSGTGGGGRYGNIGVLPFVGSIRVPADTYLPINESAAAGYFSVILGESAIQAELTSTPRVGVHRYTFPNGARSNVMVDAGAVIQVSHSTPGESTGASTGGFVEWVSNKELQGRADCQGGWGHSHPYSVFFFARFSSTVLKRQVAVDEALVDGLRAQGPRVKAIASFGTQRVVELAVGISFVSTEKAQASLDRETASLSFDSIRRQAEQSWEKALSRFLIAGATDEQQTLFYTLFYRLLCMPSDLGVNDEFPGWRSGVRHFNDFYCLWDSVRNANALVSLFDPSLEVAMLNCLLDVAKHIGWIPDAWIAGHSAAIQGASSADILICEAALKKLKGIDYNAALLQIRKNAETESPDPRYFGRYFKDYRDLGYVSADTPHCVSKHLEYAYQDWCIGTLAQNLGQTELAETYLKSSRKVWNLWREDIKGFAPRRPDGAWKEPFDPITTRPDSWNDPYFYEGTSLQWSFNVFHDFPGLVQRHGGPQHFVEHLDRFFDDGHFHCKETMLHVPYLYLYAGRPDRTADRVRECLEHYFKPTRNCLSDNEDMGCQSAFYICSTLGLYPVMGQDIYWLVPPRVQHSEITMDNGRKLMIEAPQAHSSPRYITNCRLNGKHLNRYWIRHREICEGATLTFDLAASFNGWGR